MDSSRLPEGIKIGSAVGVILFACQGNEAFVEKVQTLPGARAANRQVAAIGGKYILREQSAR